MQTLKDLKLSKKTHKKVEAWLESWLKLIEKQADNKHAWVYRADFEKDDFFYFTDCKDILVTDPEAKANENNLAIRSRKRKIMLQLLLKTMMGRNLGLITITCNHCNYRGCYIDSFGGVGHFVYCPRCKKTDIHVFPDGYDICMSLVQYKIKKWEDATKNKFIDDCCKVLDENRKERNKDKGRQEKYHWGCH